jgi:hypothetical protein
MPKASESDEINKSAPNLDRPGRRRWLLLVSDILALRRLESSGLKEGGGKKLYYVGRKNKAEKMGLEEYLLRYLREKHGEEEN